MEIPSDCIRGFTNSSVHSSTVVNRINLSIISNEMVIIPFTRKRNIKRPTLFNKTIQLISQVKYCGLTSDKKLTWKKQLDNIINKVYMAFWTCRRKQTNLQYQTTFIFYILFNHVMPVQAFS
jgi:hypothetical protein